MAETVRIEIPIETVDNTNPELSNVTKNLDRMESAANSAGNAVERAGKRVSQFDESAERTQKSLAKWVKEKYEIFLEAKDKVTPIISTIGGGLRSFSGKTWDITMKAIDLVTSPLRGIINLLKNPIFQVGAVLGVSISLKDTVDTYSNFEATMSRVKALAGANDAQMEKLTETAKEMGASTKYSGTESAEAFTYMAQAGWEVNDMISGIGGIMSLAASDGLDLATTTDIVSNALTAFGLKAKDSAEFADVLAVASSATNTDVAGLGEAFKYIAPVAGAMGYSIQDASLALGLMSNNAVKGSMAGTALKTSLANMAAPTDAMATAMDRYGISLTDSKGNMKTLKEVMDNLRGSLGGLSEVEQTAAASTIFGKEAMAGMLSIINTSEADYNKLTEAIQNSQGAADEMAETMQDNLAGAFEQLGGSVETVQLTIGERLKPYLLSLSKWIEGNMPAIEEMATEAFDALDRKVTQAKKKIAEFTSTKDWEDADFFGKVKIAWNELIAEPFSEWWNSEGKFALSKTAGNIGNAIGSGISAGLLMILGIDVSDSADEGASVGKAFASGFAEGFDFEQISSKLWDGIKNMFSSASKLLPGGESADLGSIISAYVLAKMASPLMSFGKGSYSMGKALFGPSAEGGASLMGGFLGSAGTGAGLLGFGANTAINLGAGNLAGGASLSAGALSAVGLGATAGGVAAGATLISGALDAYKAMKSDDKDESTAYGESAAWKVGGVAAGAAAGAAIGSVVPVLGTAVGALIGAGVGGIAGWIKGNKIKEEYQENLEETQEAAAKAQKVLEATGFSINDVTFETEALNDAIGDTEVSAEQLGQMFQEAVNDKLKAKFGDISLSLKEIQEIAGKIAFDDQTDGINKFAEASQTSEDSLSSLQDKIRTLDKMNWKISLGTELSGDSMEDYKSVIDNFISQAKTYLEDKHYEATVALELLTGEDSGGLSGGLNTMYEGLQAQIDDLSGQLTSKINIALEDGVITLDEEGEIVNLQQQITDITNKVTQAQEDAKFASLKIRYGGSELDSDSFASLQDELQANVESMTESYDNALEVSLTNLQLQLSEGAINEDQYNEMLQKVTDGYNAQIDGLQVRVESFQLDAIADAFDTELDGILPNMEGTMAEKLKQAMDNALKIEPDPATWTAEDIAGWFGLEGLSAETQMAVSKLLQQTAETIPERMKETITNSFSGMDFSSMMEQYGPISNEYYQKIVSESMPSLEELTGPMFLAPFSTAGLQYGNTMTTGMQNGITAGSPLLRTSAESAVSTAFLNPFSVSAKVNITPSYNILGNGPSSLLQPSSPLLNAAGAHANGGFVSGKQLSWVGEEGPEAIIPMVPGRRGRALDLYEQVGEILGVGAHANGGFVGGSNIASYTAGNDDNLNYINEAVRNAPFNYNETTDNDYDGAMPSYATADGKTGETGNGPTVQVSVQMTPEFIIPGSEAQSEEDIMQVIRRHMKEMADELGGEIAAKLEEVFSNMPLKEA